MTVKEIFTLIIIVIFSGLAGYLFYLYFEKKKQKKMKKEETMLSSIFTFVGIGLFSFFITFTKNYFYLFLMFVGITVGTGIILGLFLRWRKPREDKNESKADIM